MKLMTAIAAMALLTSTASAGFLVDDFSTPAGTASQQSGTGMTPTTQALSAPNFFGQRALLGTTTTNLIVGGGDLDAVLQDGDVAWIEWSLPSSFPEQFQGLTLVGLSFPVGDVAYDVSLNNSSIGSGTLGLSGGLSTSSESILGAGDTLRVTFTSTGLSLFDFDSVQANPEPMSAGLLGLALFGGVCRHRRRRKQVC